MDIPEQKYNNFKQFLKENLDVDAMYLAILQQSNLALFLYELNGRRGQSIEEIILDISQKANINIQNVSPDVKDKFVRYISYFREVQETIY